MSQTFVLFIVRTRCYIWCLVLAILAAKAFRTAERNKKNHLLINSHADERNRSVRDQVQSHLGFQQFLGAWC